MRLHSGAPYWLLCDALHPAPVGVPADCDVAIVGLGITGALLADALTTAGLKVTAFDRRAPGEGSTAVSTALLQYELDVELLALIEKVGEERARRAYLCCAHAIDELAALVAALGDDCGFERRPSLYLASGRADGKRLQREADARRRHGLDAEYWTREQVRARYCFPSHGAIRTRQAAVVDPVRLTRRLLARAVRHGARVCAHTEVKDWSVDAGGVRIVTDRGPARARRIVFATGYEAPEVVRHRRVALHSSYAVASYPLDRMPGGWGDECLVWETARPYCYMRTTSDRRVIVGGEDVPFRDPDARDRLLPRKTARLAREMRRLLGDSAENEATMEPQFAWAGTFGETDDGLPYIGAEPGLSGALFALGYGGNGITFGVVAARIIRDLCLGADNPDAGLFALDR